MTTRGPAVDLTSRSARPARGLSFLILLTLIIGALPTSQAAHTEGLSETVLAQAIIAQIPVIGGGASTFSFPSTANESHEETSNVTLDDETIFNTIALARQAGERPTVREVSDRQLRDVHRIDANTLPAPGPVLDALLITTFDPTIIAATLGAIAGYSLLGIQSPPLPVKLLTLSEDAWGHDDRSSQRVRLDTETTEAGLALIAGGIPVTLGELTSVEHEERHTVFREQDAALAIPVVVAAVQLGARAAAPIALIELQDSSRTSDETETHIRDVHVDRDHALLAAAASRRLIPVEASQVIQGSDTTTKRTLTDIEATIDRGTLFSALLLGAQVTATAPAVQATLSPDTIIGALVRVDITGRNLTAS